MKVISGHNAQSTVKVIQGRMALSTVKGEAQAVKSQIRTLIHCSSHSHVGTSQTEENKQTKKQKQKQNPMFLSIAWSRGVKRGSARRSSSVERTRKGYRQSDEHWNRFKQTFGETSERRGGAYMAFSERTDTLNGTELIS